MSDQPIAALDVLHRILQAGGQLSMHSNELLIDGCARHIDRQELAALATTFGKVTVRRAAPTIQEQVSESFFGVDVRRHADDWFAGGRK
jgi:hypothetical protein